MRSWTYRCLWMIVLLLGSPALAPAQATAETTILIDATKIGSHAVPRTIFGTFLEPIGNSTYNGLWAEILQNPSFENNLWDVKHIADMVRDDPELNRASEMSLPLPWEPLRYSQGSRYAPQWNDAANSQRSLLLMALPDQQTGIRQKVYLPVRRVSHYVGSVYLRHVGGPAIVEVSLRERNHPDHIFNSREIKLSTSGWQRYEFTLDVPPHQLQSLEPADFVIAASGETRVAGRSGVPASRRQRGWHGPGNDRDVARSQDANRAFRWKFHLGLPLARRRRAARPTRQHVECRLGHSRVQPVRTDEFLRFCQLIGADPQIALNLGTGTPQEAADWVQYVNAHWADHSGGLLWELGNELWGDFQIGYPTLPRVAERTKLFSAAVRR
ncbi:MAG: hypothetical protein LAO18_04475 [Acidobacteriia bacterium]|nr:hypothetical protein [Terriglobia bacterium]